MTSAAGNWLLDGNSACSITSFSGFRVKVALVKMRGIWFWSFGNRSEGPAERLRGQLGSSGPSEGLLARLLEPRALRPATEHAVVRCNRPVVAARLVAVGALVVAGDQVVTEEQRRQLLGARGHGGGVKLAIAAGEAGAAAHAATVAPARCLMLASRQASRSLAQNASARHSSTPSSSSPSKLSSASLASVSSV